MTPGCRGGEDKDFATKDELKELVKGKGLLGRGRIQIWIWTYYLSLKKEEIKKYPKKNKTTPT